MDAGRLVDARLDDAASLAVFRCVLRAAARPGAVVRAPQGPPSSVPPVYLPALALADLEIAYTVLDWGHSPWTEVIAAVTGARLVDRLGEADLVVAVRPPTGDEIAELRTGDASSPERGARLITACAGFETGMTIEVAGPGASPPRSLRVDGIDPDTVLALAEANAAFPAGIDTWLVATDGSMVGLPRSSMLRVPSEQRGI